MAAEKLTERFLYDRSCWMLFVLQKLRIKAHLSGDCGHHLSLKGEAWMDAWI